jgi:ATP-binding cassette subfamily A (ABC1) protein 3
MILAFNLRSLTDTGETFLCVILLFILFGFAVAPFTYFLSFFFENHSTAQFIIFLLNLITGAIFATASWMMRLIASSSRNVNQVLQYIFRLSPIYCFSYGIMNASNRSTYQMLFGDKEQKGALNWDIAGADVIFLAAETVGYFALVFLVEWGKTVKSIRNLTAAKDPGPARYEPDDDVETENIEAENVAPESVAVKVVNVRKVYGTRFTKGEVKVAVEKVSFRVLNKECFALLGVNGAGKTSTFRILTGEYAPTTGNAYISGTSVLTDMAEARFKIGYCPQFDAISELLTCQEHLELYGRIKGIPKKLIKPFAAQKLEEMGLEQYAKVRAGQLSGGNKRKLSVAMACIGNPPVVFLDEPSAGMDPDARKRMWKVINEIKSKQTSIILTTHSMDEAEALCDRMAIMVGGRIRCLGTSMHIKNKFGSGYELTVKVRNPLPDEVASGINKLKEMGINDRISRDKLAQCCQQLGNAELFNEITERGKGAALQQELMQEDTVSADHLVAWVIIEHFCNSVFAWLMREFNGVRTIEHFLTTSKFNIDKVEGQSLGYLFGRVEEEKQKQGIISEYSLSQTTLEQIFNTFAMQQPGMGEDVQMRG